MAETADANISGGTVRSLHMYSPNTGVIATSLRDFSWGNFGDIYKKEVVNHFEMFKSDED